MADLNAEKAARLSNFLYGLDKLVEVHGVDILLNPPIVQIDGMTVGVLRGSQTMTDDRSANPPVRHYIDTTD